jgi:hypothetical protein
MPHARRLEFRPHHPPARKSRQALLDLSTRNRLLSLPQAATARVLHFADERTDEVYRLLAGESKAMSFAPAKAEEEQAAADPAEAQETQTALALPQPEESVDEQLDARGVAQRHRDLKLQTRLSSEKLQRRLLDMYSDARTFIEEQGVNICFWRWVSCSGSTAMPPTSRVLRR